MKKVLIAGVLVSGIWGSCSESMVRSVTAQAVPTVQPTTPTIQPQQIELLNAGAEPRRELKFRPIANSQQNITMTMGMSMDILVADTPEPKTSIPTMMIDVKSAIRRVDSNGDIHSRFTYGDVKAIADRDTPPAMLATMQKQLQNLKGIKIEMVISNSGTLISKNLILPKGIDSTVKQTLLQFDRSIDRIAVKLPTEKVGLGAKWRVNDSLQIDGLRLNQSSTYEIVDISETEMKIRTQVTQSAPPQDLPIPGVSSDIQAKLTSLASTGNGIATIRFNSLLPTGGKFSMSTDSKALIQVSSKERPTNTTTKIAIDLNILSK
jgi:hypothetical protein